MASVSYTWDVPYSDFTDNLKVTVYDSSGNEVSNVSHEFSNGNVILSLPWYGSYRLVAVDNGIRYTKNISVSSTYNTSSGLIDYSLLDKYMLKSDGENILEYAKNIAPKVSSNYSTKGDIVLDSKSSLHVLNLSDEANITLPNPDVTGKETTILINNGAEFATINGKKYVSGSGMSMILCGVFTGDEWVFADNSSSKGFSGALSQFLGEHQDQAVTNISNDNILEKVTQSAIYIEELKNSIKNNIETISSSRIDPEHTGISIENDRGNALVLTIGSILDVLQEKNNNYLILNFLVWLSEYMLYGSPETPEEDNGVTYHPSDGQSLIMGSSDNGNPIIGIGDAYEVYGLGTEEPKLRIKIRPYSDNYGSYLSNFVEKHPHAGEIYEVPLTKVL